MAHLFLSELVRFVAAASHAASFGHHGAMVRGKGTTCLREAASAKAGKIVQLHKRRPLTGKRGLGKKLPVSIMDGGRG